MGTENTAEQLEEKAGYHFRDGSLLRQALTHTSYANEHRNSRLDSNERLEFLGDAVLELLSSEYIFEHYPEYPEGEMTKLRASIVCEPTLAECTRELGLADCLLLGRGEETGGGREKDSILSDAMEALIGAIYLDGGLERAKEFAVRFILSDIETKKLFYDSKTILQEMVQERSMGELVYHLVQITGPEHAKSFVSEVHIGGVCMGTGCGHNKKLAEQAAAYQTIRQLQKGF